MSVQDDTKVSVQDDTKVSVQDDSRHKFNLYWSERRVVIDLTFFNQVDKIVLVINNGRSTKFLHIQWALWCMVGSREYVFPSLVLRRHRHNHWFLNFCLRSHSETLGGL